MSKWRRQLTPEELERLAKLGRQAAAKQKGTKRPQHIRDIISRTHKGKVVSPETRRKISEAKKGIRPKMVFPTGPANPLYRHGKSSDPAYVKWQKKQRHVRLRHCTRTHTEEEWLELKKRYNYTCLFCGLSEPAITLTEAHIIPLSRGGENDIGNIQPLCLTCNLSKATKLMYFSPDNFTIIPAGMIKAVKEVR